MEVYDFNSAKLLWEMDVPNSEKWFCRHLTFHKQTNSLFFCNLYLNSVCSLSLTPPKVTNLLKVKQDAVWCVYASTDNCSQMSNVIAVGTKTGGKMIKYYTPVTSTVSDKLGRSLSGEAICGMDWDSMDLNIVYCVTPEEVYKIQQVPLQWTEILKRQSEIDYKEISDVAILNQEIFVLYQDKIRILDKQTFESKGILGLNEIKCALQFQVNKSGDFIISDWGTNRVVVLNSAGVRVHEFDMGDGFCEGVAIDDESKQIYVLKRHSSCLDYSVLCIQC